jgi:hypothetical protein
MSCLGEAMPLPDALLSRASGQPPAHACRTAHERCTWRASARCTRFLGATWTTPPILRRLPSAARPADVARHGRAASRWTTGVSRWPQMGPPLRQLASPSPRQHDVAAGFALTLRRGGRHRRRPLPRSYRVRPGAAPSRGDGPGCHRAAYGYGRGRLQPPRAGARIDSGAAWPSDHPAAATVCPSRWGGERTGRLRGSQRVSFTVMPAR